MNTPRSLDHDGLDGILPPVSKAPSFLQKYLIWFVVLLAILLLVFWFNKTKPVSNSNLKSKAESTFNSKESFAIVDAKQTKESEQTKSANIIIATESPSIASLSQSKGQIKGISNNKLSLGSANTSLKQTTKNSLPSSVKQANLDEITTITNNKSSTPILTTNTPLTVLFKFSSSEVKSLSTDESKRLSQFISSCDSKISIIGHTCNLGSVTLNYQLGLARAKSIRQYLITQGASPDFLTAHSEGMTKPIAENKTKSGRILNRRVELLCNKG